MTHNLITDVRRSQQGPMNYQHCCAGDDVQAISRPPEDGDQLIAIHSSTWMHCYVCSSALAGTFSDYLAIIVLIILYC